VSPTVSHPDLPHPPHLGGLAAAPGPSATGILTSLGSPSLNLANSCPPTCAGKRAGSSLPDCAAK
jgi:hypothetical protein